MLKIGSTLLALCLLVVAGVLSAARVGDPTQWMVFYARREGEQKLFRMHQNGAGVERLAPITSYLIEGFDAGWLYFYAPDGIYQMRGDGSALRPARNPPILARQEPSSTLFPDGEGMIFHAGTGVNQDIYWVNESESRNLTPWAGWDEWRAFSPDGAWLIFESRRDDHREVYRMRPDGSAVLNLSQMPGNDWFEAFSPDGEWVYFQHWGEPTTALYRVRLDGSAKQHLVDVPTQEKIIAAFSPDGEWVIFGQGSYAEKEIYRMRLDGTQIQNLSQAAGDDVFAAWQPIINLPWRVGWVLGGVVLAVGIAYLLTNQNK